MGDGNGFDVALFGEGWEGKAPAEMVKGTYIDNKELHKYYASAKSSSTIHARI